MQGSSPRIYPWALIANGRKSELRIVLTHLLSPIIVTLHETKIFSR
ncbi:hypothetical protein COO91_06957 [Nostoc flagelliforme CCNUN1]|uniref:Uncharacterized protein n=1 Tax=Nostoc flagelliforme CCNUN1 TaxID=2038116 RepID=A0A2K8SZQ4_9NOSO|nr:hypothetical protein COO91_06957 [Nostoc flagelliforme CCNUN1]